jgi:hypothetical protein
LFPGHYPPTEDKLREFVVDGLVVLDTNALLDLYRFTDETRAEYLKALELLGDRLWVPHRTMTEFYERRVSVIQTRYQAREDVEDGLRNAVEAAAGALLRYAVRRGFGEDVVQRIVAHTQKALDDILDELEATDEVESGVDPDAHPDLDPILQRVEALLDGKVGEDFDVSTRAGLETVGQRRLTANVPPGYRDKNKGGERAIGDFLVWEQTMRQAKDRQLPVLMINNEQKPDWTVHDRGRISPRPELVKELRDRTDQDFHLVDVRTFLTLAKEHLAADVSPESVDEASRLGTVADEVAPEDTARVTPHASTPVSAAGITPGALGQWDQAAYTKKMLWDWDPTAAFRAQLANFDATAGLRAQLANFDATAGLRAQLANFDATAGLRVNLASVDPSASLRGVMGKGESLLYTAGLQQDSPLRIGAGFSKVERTAETAPARHEEAPAKKTAPTKAVAKKTATKKAPAKKTATKKTPPKKTQL